MQCKDPRTVLFARAPLLPGVVDEASIAIEDLEMDLGLFFTGFRKPSFRNGIENEPLRLVRSLPRQTRHKTLSCQGLTHTPQALTNRP